MAGRSGRFGQAGIGTDISLRFDASSMLHLTDKVTGWFRGGAFQRALAEANETAAIVVQQGMVDELEREVRQTGRVQRGTNLLELSLMHENNREVFANTFRVGRESWLDRSPAALYWRRIEEGDARTFDSFILFTNNFSSYYGPWSPGSVGSQRIAGAMRSGHSGGTFSFPKSRKQPAGYKHMRMPQHRGAFVQNIGPYPAYEFSAGGPAAFRRMGGMKALYTAHLARVGIDISDVMRKK